MPSPLGHALAGAAVGLLIHGRVSSRASLARQAVAFGLVGAAPDLDLLVGAHSGPTHGVGAAVLVGLLVWGVTRRGIAGLAAAAAYGTHTLLDWMGSDTSPPIGIMALWPLTREYYESSLHLFMAISRRYWLPEFWVHNLRAVGREILFLGPLGAVAWWLRARRLR